MNRRRQILIGAVAGFLLTAPLIALMYLGERLAGLPMTAFDLFESLSRIPQLGPLVTKGIDVMISIASNIPGVATDKAGKTIEQLAAVGLFLIIGAIVGAIYAAVRERAGRSVMMFIGLIVWTVALLVEIEGQFSSQLLMVGLWLAVILGVWGYALSLCIDTLTIAPASTDAPTVATDRRKFLIQFGGGALALTLGSWAVGALFGRRSVAGAGQAIAAATPEATLAATTAATEAVAKATAASAGSFVIVPGTRPELTENRDFYRVDTNVVGAPAIDEKTWALAVGGLVNTPISYSYDEFRKLPVTEQYATLQCISNPVGGDLISTTKWMGVQLREVLQRAGLKDGVAEIKFTCSDGYTEALPLESAMDERTLLAFGMNGETLAETHGFPLRLYVPNRYGMKNPKWITQIDAVADPYDGYWEVRGWDRDAIMKSTSVIDVMAVDLAANGIVPVGGMAFSGDRGISSVEISVDNGDWMPAQLKAPISPLTWTLWRLDWKATPGKHELRVRTVDGKGAPQIETRAPLHPDGASGYDTRSTEVPA
jgi:DMSO/TMAO reductase YedYZ molybdopterin-dependent catalytic subunit